MNTIMASIAALVLSTLLTLAPAMAAGPRASGGGVVHTATETTRAPHWEWQYSYAGHHPRYTAHWVLVR